MNRLNQVLRTQFHVRPGIIGACIFALGTLFIAPVFGSGTSTNHSVYMVSDDINDVANPVDMGDWDTTQPPATDTGPGNDGAGSNDTGPGNDGAGSNDTGNGHDNNGHGNNTDGVDSSNPGQGQGGPNGQVDESCDGTGECVDDENGTGNGQGNGNGHGNGNGRRP